MELLNRRRYGKSSPLPDPCISFIFNQTGEGEVVTPIKDTGLLDYLVENIKIYQGKYQEDGSMLVTELVTEINPNYEINVVSYLDGSFVHMNQGDADYFTHIPTIYYKSIEISPDKFKIKFSAYPFPNAKKVFGENNLIGYGSGCLIDDNFYANKETQGSQITLTQAKRGIANRGIGYYGMTSDEMGVLMFLTIYYDKNVNGFVLTNNSFLGIDCVFVNGDYGRMCPPNIEIDNAVAKVTHLDGNIEYLNVPYIWNGPFSKLHIGKYLTILPKEEGNGIYYSKSCYIGNADGIAMYCPCFSQWQIGADRNDTQLAQDSGTKLKIRPCFKGKIVETKDVEWFKSLPIIN